MKLRFEVRVSSDSEPASNRLLYIGGADAVPTRVGGHEYRPAWEKKLGLGEELCFSVAVISPTADRQQAEAAMINHHKPPSADWGTAKISAWS
ncbi:MAG TPA: hypothetical protein VMV19_03840 [Xanthobacteraceae bacterium]|nr:hypothetical protein [Xanthobacteraceae bacterium]